MCLFLFRVVFHVGLFGFGYALYQLCLDPKWISPEKVQLWSMIHMLACTVMALMFVYMPGTDKSRDRIIYYGNKVSLLGYLQTLIGISAALLYAMAGDELGPAAFMKGILAPTSSALLTSFIGWWIGGSIKNRANRSDDKGNQEVENLRVLLSEARVLLNSGSGGSAGEVSSKKESSKETLGVSIKKARSEAEETAVLFRELNGSIRESAIMLKNSCDSLKQAIELLDLAYRRCGLSAGHEGKSESKGNG
jgi:hypothetical protein